jgi:2-dehydropantoate 2-reductase
MLQDLEAGRPLEIEAVVGAVVELGEKLGVAMPATRAVYALVKLKMTPGIISGVGGDKK